MNDSTDDGAKALALIRISANAVFLWQFWRTSFRALGELPVEIMHPPGLMEYISWKFYDRLMTPTHMQEFKWIIIVALLSSAVGFKTSWSTKVSVVLVILYEGILRSFGHVNHDEYVGMYVLLILAFVPCSDRYSLDAWLKAPSMFRSESITYWYPIHLMQAVMAWSYFSTGVLKLRNGGLAYFLPDQLPTLAIQHSLGNLHDTQYRIAFMLPSIRMVTPILLVIVVLWEVTFPVGIVFKRSRWIYLGFGVVFHVSTVLLMNIGFWNHLAMYLIFVNWTKLRQSMTRLTVKMQSIRIPTPAQRPANA